MATFNQQGQVVQYQYNADSINFGSAKSNEDFVKELKNLKAELDRAIQGKAIEGEAAIDAESHVKKAILNAESAYPDKKSLLEHLESAKSLVTSVSGLAGALGTAIARIGTFF